jgi:transcriptional regulator with XRE-family HTH domain
MSEITLFDKYMEDEDFARLMAQEDLIMDVTESFCEVLEREKINRSDLAKKMGKTKGYISQLLNGGKNLTLRSISDLAFSLGRSVKFSVVHKEGECDSSSFVIDFRREKNKRRPIAGNSFTFADDYSGRSSASLAG